ncbi:AAA domain-containing protein [Rhizobium leguminosarum bv. viciae]|nr:AAA family ATPase [Rhizobium sp. PEPV16]NKM01247.1 AAA domain-containing protein [Rhizobium leguminosarum bv. viciae]NKN02856.1 AAA domain-containing protein [Rhizobium leguminosarum bv. viciae]
MAEKGRMVNMDQTALRPATETLHAAELAKLEQADKGLRPPGWRLSARAVRSFVLGDPALGISRKFYGDDALVERAIVSLMGEQGLLLVGEPGTAKSMLSELLAAAVTGSTRLVVQGSAGTMEEHLRYGWNYALLIAEGPSEKALVPSPVLQAMRAGLVMRIEELTRCPPEIQDGLISILSEKMIAIPELGDGAIVRAAPGFNIIGTANLRDRGVSEMSSALKRRFNFETVHPITDPAFERELIERRLADRLAPSGIKPDMSEAALGILVSCFQDLRAGRTAEGVTLQKPTAVMSTAEAVNVAHAAALEAAYLGDGRVTGAHLARQIGGIVMKDDPEDGRKFKSYVDHIVKDRARSGSDWRSFYEAARALRLD